MCEPIIAISAPTTQRSPLPRIAAHRRVPVTPWPPRAPTAVAASASPKSAAQKALWARAARADQTASRRRVDYPPD